jgi:hypothetical protein
MKLTVGAKTEQDDTVQLRIRFALGHAVALLVEALCYRPECRGFEPR